MRWDKLTVKEVTEEREEDMEEEERITVLEEFRENIVTVTSANVKMDLDKEEREVVVDPEDINERNNIY